MNIKHLAMTALLAVGTLAAAPTYAQAQQDLGWYLGGGVGLSKTDDDTELPGFAVAVTRSDDDDMGWKLFGGYQFHRNFAVEIGYADLGEFSTAGTTVPAGTFAAQTKVKAWYGDLIGIMPLGNNFSVHGRVGLVYSETKGSATGTGAVVAIRPSFKDHELSWKAGLGVGYDFSRTIGVRGDWEHFRVSDGTGGKGDVNLFSVSLRVKF